jgi:hypothetical protein
MKCCNKELIKLNTWDKINSGITFDLYICKDCGNIIKGTIFNDYKETKYLVISKHNGVKEFDNQKDLEKFLENFNLWINQGKKRKLTEKQNSVFNYIKLFMNNNSFPPTVREIGDNFNITAKGAYDYLKAIENKGHIEIIPKISRGIKVLQN